ncbi:MAG TPA: histidine kinase [Actinomycetota bacterium]|nr:histidine kinase [Actinomycetota bacterium]
MRRARPDRLVVFVAGCDEYTTLLVARHLPQARIATAESRRCPRLAVVEAADAAAVAAVERCRAETIVAIADRQDPRLPFEALTVVRPFAPGVLFDAIDDQLQQPARDRYRPTLLAAIRLALITLGAGVRGFGDGAAPDLAFVSCLVLYGVARMVGTRFEHGARAIDVGVACALVAATEGAHSGFVPFAALTVVAAGLAMGWRAGAVAGGLVSLAAGTPEVIEAIVRRTPLTDALALLALFPLAGMTGGFAQRIHGAASSREKLAETNRLLTRLHGIAREIPGAMDAQTVASAVVDELREMGAPAAAVLDDGTELSVRAGYGVAHEPIAAATSLRACGEIRILDVDAEPRPVREALAEHRHWIVAPAVRNGRFHGILLAAVGEAGAEATWRGALTRLAGDAAVAFENAELLRRVGALAADEERRRIALRVHDGLAQTLTHLRLELDFIVRHDDDGDRIRREIQRLSHVLDRAIGDVHGLMHDLKTDRTDEEPPAIISAPDSGKERMPA